MLTRAELEKKPATSERRTMQFLIERECSAWIAAFPSATTVVLDVSLPMVVWVELPVVTDGSVCDGKRWLVIPEEVALLASKHPPLPKGMSYGQYVCEHMGHLIE